MDKVLNVVAFGALMSRLSIQTDRVFSIDEVTDIGALVFQAVNVPETSYKVNLDALFNAIKENKKIDAIREHRMLTGYELKESKDAIESIWPLSSLKL